MCTHFTELPLLLRLATLAREHRHLRSRCYDIGPDETPIAVKCCFEDNCPDNIPWEVHRAAWNLQHIFSACAGYFCITDLTNRDGVVLASKEFMDTLVTQVTNILFEEAISSGEATSSDDVFKGQLTNTVRSFIEKMQENGAQLYEFCCAK